MGLFDTFRKKQEIFGPLSIKDTQITAVMDGELETAGRVARGQVIGETK